jgi:hypothetical protein
MRRALSTSRWCPCSAHVLPFWLDKCTKWQGQHAAREIYSLPKSAIASGPGMYVLPARKGVASTGDVFMISVSSCWDFSVAHWPGLPCRTFVIALRRRLSFLCTWCTSIAARLTNNTLDCKLLDNRIHAFIHHHAYECVTCKKFLTSLLACLFIVLYVRWFTMWHGQWSCLCSSKTERVTLMQRH